MADRYLPHLAALVVVVLASAGAYFFFFKKASPPSTLTQTGSLELRLIAREVAGRTVGPEGIAVEVLFDASGSMRSVHPASGRRKIDEAKEALRRFVERAPEGLRLGLRVFGTSTPNTEPYKAEGCRDTIQLIPIGNGARPAEILRAVEGIEAMGWTPLGYSMRQAVEDFRGVNGPKRLVVITDGRERCQAFGGDPAEAVRALAEADIEVKVAFIGGDAPRAVRRALAELAEVGEAEVMTLAGPSEIREILAEAAEALVAEARATDQASQATFKVSTGSPSRLPAGKYTLEIPPIAGVVETPTRLSDLPVLTGKTTRIDVLFVEGEARVEITTR